MGVAIAMVLGACAAHHVVDGGTDAGSPADAADPLTDAGPICTCRTGRYHAYGEGRGFTIDHDLEVRECDGALTCTIDGTPRRCYMGGGAFRVDLDSGGWTQLVFSRTPCNAPWTGSYATSGGLASVTATRVEE